MQGTNRRAEKEKAGYAPRFNNTDIQRSEERRVGKECRSDLRFNNTDIQDGGKCFARD